MTDKPKPTPMQEAANEAERWIEDIMRGSTRDTHYTQAVMQEAAKRIHQLARIVHTIAKKEET